MTDISTKRYNLDNFEASFREFLQNGGKKNNSIKNYLSDLRHFMGWFTFYLHSNHERAGQAPPLQENPLSLASMIDFEAVTSYKTYLESNALPSKTINRRLSTLRKFCSFCISQNWMKENPAKKVTNITSIVGHPERLSESEGKSKEPLEIATSSLDSLPAGRQARNDILSDFKQYLLSGQSNQMGRDALQCVSTKDVNLITSDVQEFLSICHPT